MEGISAGSIVTWIEAGRWGKWRRWVLTTGRRWQPTAPPTKRRTIARPRRRKDWNKAANNWTRLRHSAIDWSADRRSWVEWAAADTDTDSRFDRRRNRRWCTGVCWVLCKVWGKRTERPEEAASCRPLRRLGLERASRRASWPWVPEECRSSHPCKCCADLRTGGICRTASAPARRNRICASKERIRLPHEGRHSCRPEWSWGNPWDKSERKWNTGRISDLGNSESPLKARIDALRDRPLLASRGAASWASTSSCSRFRDTWGL